MDFAQLQAAVEQNDIHLIQQWLASDDTLDVDMDVDDQFGATLLQWACHWNRIEIAQSLLARSADPNHKNAFLGTPLHWACKQGAQQIVELLLRHGADATALNGDNDSPADIATKQGHPALASMLNNPKWLSTESAKGSPATIKSGVVIGKPVDVSKTKSVPPHPLIHSYRYQRPSVGGSNATQSSSSVFSANTNNLYNSGANIGTANGSATPSPAVGGSRALVPKGNSSHIPIGKGSLVLREDNAQPVEWTYELEALTRAKVKAEIELQAAQKLIDELRTSVEQLQKDRSQTVARAKASDDLFKRVDALQREKMAVQQTLLQTQADQERLLTKLREEHKDALETNAKTAADAIAKLEAENGKFAAQLQDVQNNAKRDILMAQQLLATKNAEVEELRVQLTNAQRDAIRLQVEVEALSYMRTTVEELEKDKAMLKAESETLRGSIEELQQEKVNTETKLREAESKLNETQVMLQTARHQIDLLNTELQSAASLREEMLQAKRTKAAMEVQIQSLNMRLEELRAQSVAGSNTADAVKKMEAFVAEVIEERLLLRQQLIEANEKAAEHSGLVRDIEDLRKREKQLLGDQASTKAKVTVLEKDLAQSRETGSQLQKDVQSLRVQLEAMHKEKAQWTVDMATLTKYKDMVESLTAERTDWEAQSRLLPSTVESLKAQITRLQEENNALQAQGAAYAQVAAAQAEVKKARDELLDELTAARGQLTNANAQLRTVDAECASLREEKKGLQGRCSQFDSDLRRLQSEVSALTDQLLEARKAMAMSEETMRTVGEERDRLANERKEWDAEMVRLKVEWANSLARQKTETQGEMYRELQGRDHDQQQLRGEIDRLRDQVHQYERYINDMGRQQQSANEREQQLEAQLRRAETEIEGLRRRIPLLESERQGLELQIRSLREQAADPLTYSASAVAALPAPPVPRVPTPQFVSQQPQTALPPLQSSTLAGSGGTNPRGVRFSHVAGPSPPAPQFTQPAFQPLIPYPPTASSAPSGGRWAGGPADNVTSAGFHHQGEPAAYAKVPSAPQRALGAGVVGGPIVHSTKYV